MATDTNILLNTIRSLEYKLSAIQQLAGLINVSSDLETTSGRVLEHMLKLVGAEAALMVVFQEGIPPRAIMVRDGKIADPAVDLAELAKRLGRELQTGLAGIVLKERSSLIVPDVRVDTRFRNDLCQSFGYAATSAMIMPLATPRGPLGVLNIFNKIPEGSAFTPDDLSIASSLTALIGVVIESAKVFTDVDRRVSELNNLIRANEFINSSLDLDTVLDTIIPLGMRVIDAEAGSILLMDPEKKQLYFAAASGVKKEEVKRIYLNKGEGIAGWVVEHGKSLLIPDVSKDERFTKKVDESSGFVTKSILATPLVINDEVIGVVEAINKTTGGSFTERDVHLLKTLAVTSALAIQKARLFGAMNGMFLDTIQALVSAMEAKDPFSIAHTERVRNYAVSLARSMEAGETELTAMERAAVLHEVGRLRIPPSEDRSWRERIGVLSAELVSGIHSLKEIVPMIKHFQERWDGQGRPDGLDKENIPLGARILAVAEVYDRLTAEHHNQTQDTREAALNELAKRSGSELDPQCVSHFIQIQKNRPIITGETNR